MSAVETSEQVFKAPYDAADEMEKFLEHLRDGLSLTNRRFADRYIRGELWLRVHVRVFGESGNPVDFCAVFHNGLISGGQGDDGQLKIGPARMLMPSKGREVKSDDRAQAADRNQQPMLVHNVEIMKTPEVVIPSLVWFGRVDEVYRGAAHSLYHSRASGFVFLDIIKDRVSRRLGWRPSACENKLVGEMVKDGSQVVDRVSEDGDDVQWNLGNFANPEHPVSRLRIILDDDLVWVGLKEGVKTRAEIADVLVGPFDFDEQPQHPF